MRANSISIQNNLNAHDISGEVDLSAAGAVLATRGDSLTCTKTGTGTYVVRVKAVDQGYPALFEVLNRGVQYVNTTPATALGCKITTVTADSAAATKGDLLITLITTATAGGTGIATDTTAAATLSFSIKFRTRPVY